MKTTKIEKNHLPHDLYEILKAYHANYKDWIISGGFARLVGHKVLGIDWGKKTELSQYLSKSLGDIDFFTNVLDREVKSHKEVDDAIINLFVNKSNDENITSSSKKYTSEFAKNLEINVYADRILYNERIFSIKNQFIKKYAYKSIEDMSYSFDLINSRWFIDLSGKDLLLVYDEKAQIFDQMKYLDIGESDKNPLLADRIVKYIKRRGLENGIHEDSKSKFKYFLCTASADMWNDVFVDILLKRSSALRGGHINSKTVREAHKFSLSKDAIYTLSNSRLLSKEDYSTFLGKWKIDVPVYEEYCMSPEEFVAYYGIKHASNNNIYKRIVKFEKSDFAKYHIQNFEVNYEEYKSKSNMGF